MILLILVIGLVLRVIGIDQSFWLDEAITATISRDLTTIEIITKYLPLDNSPPGYILLINFLYGFLPNNEIVDRIPSVIFGLGTILVLYFIAKDWIDRKFGYLVALILVTSPLHIYYSHEGRMYSLATLLATVAIWLTLKFVKTGGGRYLIWYVVCGIGVIYTHYVAALILLATNLIVLLLGKMSKRWIFAQFLVLVSFGIWLPIFTKQLILGVNGRNVSEVFDKVLGKFDIKALPVTFEKFVLGKIPINEDISLVFIIPSLILFAFLLIWGFKKCDNKHKKIISAWLLLPLLVAYLISIKIPVFLHYRVLFVLPAFYLGIALGISQFKGFTRKVIILLVIIINLSATLIYYIDPNLQREQWRQAVSWVEESITDKPSVVLFASGDPAAPYLWYRKDHPEAYGAFEGFYINTSTDRTRVDELVKDKSKVLVFKYLQDITDPDKTLQKWVEENDFHKKFDKSFVGVGEIEVYEH